MCGPEVLRAGGSCTGPCSPRTLAQAAGLGMLDGGHAPGMPATQGLGPQATPSLPRTLSTWADCTRARCNSLSSHYSWKDQVRCQERSGWDDCECVTGGRGEICGSLSSQQLGASLVFPLCLLRLGKWSDGTPSTQPLWGHSPPG